MTDLPLDELLGLERRGWDSLCDGTGDDFYGALMTDDGLMVLANGAVLTRDQVVSSLADAPPWASYDIEEPRLVTISDDAAVLVYTGTGRRDGGPDFRGVMSSTYVRRDGAWRLAAYTQTPIS